MSQQIELDGSNLCIPEDAFEKFQAVSMYEETEFITLTNIVPTQTAESCVGDDTIMTSNDDAVVELSTDNEVYVNTKCDDGESRSPLKTDPATNNDHVNTTQPISGDLNEPKVTSNHGKKRGRKKKKTSESSAIMNESHSECENILGNTNGPSESIEDIQNFIHSTDPASAQKRRGRRPKSSNVSSDELSSSMKDLSKDSINDTKVVSLNKEPDSSSEKRLYRKRGRPSKSHENVITTMSSSNEDEVTIVDSTEQQLLSDNSDSSKKILKRRGRPRNISHEEKTDQIEILSTVDDSKSSDILDSLPEAIFTTKLKKKGRPKKKTNMETVQSQNESQNENVSSHKASLEYDDDDISLSNLSKMNHLKTDIDGTIDNEDKIQLQDLLDSDYNTKLDDNEKHLSPIKKRGRPKKAHTESDTQALSKLELQKDNHDSRISDDDKDDGDDISLSQFKKTLHTNDEVAIVKDTSDTNIAEQDSQPISSQAQEESNIVKTDSEIQSSGKRNSKMPIMSDFEYNLDSIVNENNEIEIKDAQTDDAESLLVEDVSKRPIRKKVRQTLQYHEESDEDPFANVELSDDEPRRTRKGRRYNSDDEYFPGDVREPATPSSSDSESNEELDNDKTSRKRKCSKKLDSQSPRKKGRKPNSEKTVETVKSSEIKTDYGLVNDIEDCLHSSVIKTNDETSKAWGTTTEFENFLAKKIQGTNLKIKKVSSTENADAITPLQIPTIDPSEPKKTIEMCTQTTKITTSNVNVQTSCPYDIPMKESVTLTAEQSAKSCEFLTSIVNTTTELGKLMTQKSEDFIKKKINTDHVTDTLKMDYCVRKSFLLFKLAKHNLTQMEEDLAKQYEQFLVENDLLKYREEPKIIIPTVQADSDSDCEIVEVPVVEEVKKTSKSSKFVPKFNPKTVFLNKELSIKIAKKPSDDKKINIKGKHTVWINDSVMVKKVKPTQSFLAQDSRNKKPPDQNVYVTAEMVSDFFEDYYRKKSLATCALFTSPEWLKVNSNYVCNYFIVKQELNPGVTNNETVAFVLNGANPSTSTTNTIHNINIVKNILEMSETSCPERLITLCTEVLRKLMPISKCNGINTMVPINDQHPDKVLQKKPRSLFELCINVFNLMMNNNTKDEKCSYESRHNLHINKYTSVKNTVLTLKILCLKKVSELMLSSAISYEFISKTQFEDYLATENRNDDHRCFIKKHNAREIKSLFSLCVDTICYNINGRDKYFKPVCQRGKNCKRQIIQPQIKHHMREVRSLFSLCVESIGYAIDGSIKYVEPFCLRSNDSKEQVMHSEIKQYRKEVKSLFSLCVESIRFVGDNSNKCVIHPKIKQHLHENNSFSCLCIKNKDSIKRNKHPVLRKCGNNIKPLFSLCVESIQMAQKNGYQRKYIQVSPKQLQYIPKSLMQISFKNIVGLLFNHQDFMIRRSPTEITQALYINDELAESFTINSVNTLSEEAFHNLQNTVEDPYYEDFDNEESYLNNDGFEVSYEGTEDLGVEDNNWASQVQMKELRSCVNINNTGNTHPLNCDGLNSTHVVAIKSEPIEDALDNVHDSILVKIEPVNELDEMTMIPDSVITKSEVSVSSHAPDGVVNLVNRSFSVDTFEEFVRKNKIIQSLNDSTCNEVYSQSSLRVRRQFEPDYDGENDAVDGLLIPHTYTNIYNAKDCLMESSSDEVNAEKNMGKKKPVKRKVKPKKVASKTVNKDVAPPAKERSKFEASEVDELTKKMKDRIRQEEIENQSSESELEDLPLTKRRNKGIVKETNKKSTSTKDIIQCNDVDSTEQGNNSQLSSILNNVETTSSSSNSDKQNDSFKTKGKIKSHIKKKSVDFEGPLELLECEPTIHENSDDDFVDSAEQLSKSIDFALSDPRKDNISKPNNYAIDDHVPKEPLTNKEGIEIVERCGWLCCPINTKDTKLYQEPSVLLDKLPESFVQTYFEYQEITEQNQVDREIDRLTNVNSLNRSSKDKGKTKPRSKVGTVDTNKPSQINATSLLESFNVSEQAHEFAPSDDDEANIDAELPPPVPQRHAENTLAKSSLMDDESENEGRSVSPQTSHKIKQEPAGDAPVKKRAGPKSKTRIEGPRIPDGELVLTADKMMQEELTLLHAPVTLNSIEVNNKIQTTHREPVPKTRSKHPRKVYQRVKSEEDSSSEEEKQWVSTKEKLLKKLKKAPDASASDAKRAKMVTEFIEKRGEGSESRKVTRGKYRGSRKKFLEREKQLKVLSKELYGESATDSYPRKSYVTMNYKGRRNIRKVIDKKSLERSTVKAIMEEFERKRRLNDKQNKLRAHLGCEENVNVLVINDEVCLEYDFEEDRPAVTVHAFFTKVMKAHQYEGVKFMWDACFESVDKMEAGHPGGGCILAHCMGLGKTLQVLALLHTVLTHPQVGMKRVLVCCPLSTVLNWVDEIHKWIGPVTDQLKVFELSKLKKTYERAYQLEDWYNGGGIFIIGYELFRSLSTLDPCLDDVRPTIIKKIRTALLDPGPDIVVCDEGHLLKNDCSVLAVAMSRVATRRRIVLTGTPMQNNLREYYCMVNFIKPNLLGSYSEYSNRFANPIMNGQHRDSSEEDIKLMKTRTHILHKVLEGCLQRQEASVLYPYLPKKHEYTVFIPLTKCQWDLYKHYIYTYCKHNKQSILKDFHILQKIWSHPLVLHNFHTKLSDYRKAKEEKLEDDLAAEDLTVDDIKPADTEVWWLQYLDGGNMLETLESSNKFLAVFRILNECVELGDKVLIFSTSLFCLDSLEYFLKKINKWSLGQEYYRLDGSVPPEVRHKWCREFNADNNTMTRLFLISTRAGSLGLNMTAANRVIILDTSWNPAHDIQSIFRVYRFGQKKDCFIYRLVAMGTMEQKIYERSVTKQAVACRVVDEQQIDRHYNSADLAELYRLDEAGGSVEGGVAAGVRDVALLRVARDGPVHAVHEHDSLLRASEPALPEHERAAAWQQFQNERAAEQNKPPTTKKGKMSVKGAQNTKAQTVAEINRESITDNEAQTTDIIKCSIPIQTAKPVFFSDDSVRNDISNNVVHTLIKHSFPNMQEIKDVTHVVNVVRNIVAKVEANEDNKDMVSGIIAQSMFQNSKEPLERMADIVIKDLNLNIAADTNQLKQLQKPSPSSQKPVTLPQKQSARLRERLLRNRNQLKEEASSEPHNDTKPKEKKKNSAPEAPSTMTDIVIELNEDVEQRSHDSSATISADEITTEPEEAARPNTKKYKKAVKNKKKLTERVVEQPTITDNSILLSDEDDVSIVPTSLPPDAPQKAQNVPIKVGKKIPNQTVQITQNQTSQKSPAPVGHSTTNQTVAGPSTYSTGKKREAREDKTVEPVPLHPSLLTNKHFITIVAHTYLEGNPLLDEDAATLAAQYSTHKAKKEIEAGRRITSGPLYDIAVKALSMETLQKLHNVAPKVPQATMVEAAASLQLEESLIDMEQSGTLTRPLPAAAPPPELPAIKKISKIREYRAAVKNPLVSETYSAVPVPPLHAIPTASSNVVPVELFKGPSMQSSGQYSRQNHEESILPDDNSSAINTNVPPPICNPLSVSAPAPKIILSHRKKPPIIVRTMLTAPKPAAQPSAVQTTANAKVSAITAVGGQIVLDPQISTICLDSDDEDTAPPSPPHRPPPGPVPVALTRVNTAQHMPVTRVVSAPAPTPAPVPPPGLTPAPAPGYFIASPSGSAVNNYINATTTPINTYAIPASNSPALVAISAPLNSFVTPVIISTANSNSTPTVTSSSHPHKTINTELPPKSLAPDEKQAKPNHFILKINNKTLRVVQSSAPPESVKTIYKLGKNDKLLPSVTNAEPPTTSENANKDRKNLVAIKPAPAVSTEASITENVRKNQSSVSTGTPLKNTNTKKSMTLKIDPKKARDTSTNQRVSTVRKSSDAVPSNSDKRDDLLDIFKDIVHIQAYDTEKTSQGVKPSNNKANNSLIKPSTNKIKSTVDLNSPGYKIKTLKEFSPLPNQTKSSVEVKQSFEFKKIAPKPTSGADLLLSFSKDTINTFSSLLAKRKASLQATSTSKTVTKDLSNPKEVLKTGVESKKAKISAKAADSFIDLTSHSTAGPSKSIDSKHNKNKITPTLADSKQNKTKPKVVNLTKNIVAIEKPVLKLAKGAIATVDITGESSKSKSNTKTKSNVQLTSSNEKKRPTTTVDIKPTKKKKVEELTLQDFDIDDLDDIIELE